MIDIHFPFVLLLDTFECEFVAVSRCVVCVPVMASDVSVNVSGFSVDALVGLLLPPEFPPNILIPLESDGIVVSKVGTVLLETSSGGLVAAMVGFVLLELSANVPEKKYFNYIALKLRLVIIKQHLLIGDDIKI